MNLRRFFMHITLGAAALSPGLIAFAQQNSGTYSDGTSTAKRALDESQQFPQADDAAQQIDAYDPNPSFPVTRETAENPGVLDSQGRQQATYGDLVVSTNRQPRYNPDEIKALVGPSIRVSNDPQTYLGGVDASGQPISCQPVPFGGATPTTYETSCNTGAAVAQTSSICTMPLRVAVTNTNSYQYFCTSDAFDEGGGGCSAFSEGFLSGACRITNRRVVRPCLVRERSGFCPEPGEPYTINTVVCNAEVSGKTPVRVIPGTPVVTETRDTSACTSIEQSGSCSVTEETCLDPTPTTRVIDGVSITRSCWNMSRSYNCDVVTRGNSDCQSLESNPLCRYDRTECLDAQPANGSCNVEDRIYTCSASATSQGSSTAYVCADGIYCVNGECQQVEAQPSNDFPKAVAALNSVSQAGQDFDPNNVSIFTGKDMRCSKPVFGITNCCNGGSGIPLIGACSNDERLLAKAVDNGLTHRVGSYCSKSFLGICSSRRTTYCVFQSKLGRLIQEQGRPQLNLSWGKPKEPVCRGITPDEFSRLDLSKFNFSEVIDDMASLATIPNEAQALADLQAKIRAYYTNPVR
ncbi:MAG: conjugal transfer protein TraN [Sphingomonadales bacterium]|nr:conjugal transfer protein TraN [Sphingomonadales bacterium]